MLERALRRIGRVRISPRPLPTHTTAEEILGRVGRERYRLVLLLRGRPQPLDHQVSLYRYILSTPAHREHRLIRSLGGFEAYLRWRCSPETCPPERAEREETFRLQSSYLLSPGGAQLVYFVGRFERLDEDFARICSRLGITASLPRVNVAQRGHYRGYYGEETRALVRRAFARDVDLLGYDF